MPDHSTVYSSNDLRLTQDSKAWNGSVTVGYRLTDSFGIAGKFMHSHDQSNFRIPDRFDLNKFSTTSTTNDMNRFQIEGRFYFGGK